MANNYSKILELANKNNMGLSNTIKRDYGIPLDYSSVQETYEAALAYAQTSTLAYIGQPISVGDVLYVVTDEANGYLKAVGTKPVGDNESIVVAEDGTVSIKGFSAAGNTQLPRVKVTTDADGKETRALEWVPIDAIVQGDGNTKTVVAVAENSAITITPAHDEDSDTYTYTLDVTLPAIPAYSVTKEAGTDTVTYKLTKDGAAVGESIVVPNAYDDTALANRVSGTEGRLEAVEADVDDHEDRIAGVEEKVNTFFATVENPDDVIDTLSEIQKYITEDKSGATGMAASIKQNTDAIGVLNGTGTGSVKKTVDDAIAAQATIDSGVYATQATLEAVKATADAAAVKTVVDAALEGKVDKTTLGSYYLKTETYSQEEIDDLLENITTESGATAGQVDSKLEAHIAASDAKFTSLEAKDEAHDSAIQKNKEDIAAITNETTGILAQAKAAAAEDAQTKVNALANGTVAQNTAAIEALDTKVTNTNTNVTNLTTRVGALEQADINITNDLSALSGAHSTLSGTVGGHTTQIKALEDKDIELAAAIEANTNKFADYSTTTVVEQKINAAISGINYKDFTDGIAANAKAISDETARADAEEKRLAGLIAANTQAAQTNASEIARVEGVLNAAIENEDGTALNSIKELAEWITEHDGANGVLATVNANKAAIDKLNGTGEGSVQKTVADAIANIPATPIATYTTAGIVKASPDINVDADGVMSLGENVFSTDRIVQGTNTLVLNGGSASAPKVTA